MSLIGGGTSLNREIFNRYIYTNFKFAEIHLKISQNVSVLGEKQHTLG